MIPLLLALVLAQDTGAEAYRKMSEALDASTLAGTVRGRVETGGKTLTAEGSIRLKAPNQLKLDLTVGDGKQLRATSLVCDGTRTLDRSGDQTTSGSAPSDLQARYRAGFKPLGATALHLFGGTLKYSPRARNDLPDYATLITTDGFESRGNEAVDGRDARTIGYNAKIKDGQTLRVRLWIDAATSLPVKREVEGSWAGMAIKIVETTLFTTGGAMADDEFAIPEK